MIQWGGQVIRPWSFQQQNSLERWSVSEALHRFSVSYQA